MCTANWTLDLHIGIHTRTDSFNEWDTGGWESCVNKTSSSSLKNCTSSILYWNKAKGGKEEERSKSQIKIKN